MFCKSKTSSQLQAQCVRFTLKNSEQTGTVMWLEEKLQVKVKLLYLHILRSLVHVYTFIKVGERFAGQAGLQAGGGDWEPRRYGKAGRRQSQRNVTRGEELIWEQVSDGGAEHGVCMEHPPDQWRSHRVNVLQREKGNKNIFVPGYTAPSFTAKNVQFHTAGNSWKALNWIPHHNEQIKSTSSYKFMAHLTIKLKN